MAKILIVDDESDIRELVSDILSDEGYETITAVNAKTAIDAVKAQDLQLVVLDIWLEGSEFDGIGVLKIIKQLKPNLPVIMISGHGNVETAVETIKHGAYDFIEKPFKAEKIIILAERAIEVEKLSRENSQLKAQQQINSTLDGKSRAIQNVLDAAKVLANAHSRVLITGESGSGKEVLARMIHKQSSRKDKQFVTLYANSLSEGEFESELFGIDDGKNYRVGLLERADKGVLFIDEVSEMPKSVQAKFLKFLQENTFYKVGNNNPLTSDIRIIAASTKNLEKEVENGRLSKSLFYRLNVASIRIPSLRERSEDVKVLTNVFLTQLSKNLGLQKVEISEEALAFLEMYHWPGNVRQLRNLIEWLMLINKDPKKKVEVGDLPVEIRGGASESSSNTIANDIITKPLKVARDMFEKEYLEAQLSRFSGNISKTAEYIGMERTALHRKIKSLGIEESRLKQKNNH
jgi:two-component system nitrogen regulation response regulator NtrX